MLLSFRIYCTVKFHYDMSYNTIHALIFETTYFLVTSCPGFLEFIDQTSEIECLVMLSQHAGWINDTTLSVINKGELINLIHSKVWQI